MRRLVSQPLSGLDADGVVQSPKLVLQVGAHLALLHAIAIVLVVEQVRLHAPQFATLETALSQPFDAIPSQLPNPFWQDGTHAPA